MHIVTVLFHVKPGYEGQFRQEMARNAHESLASEPGCRQFDVCCDPAAPGFIFLYEVYESKRDFELHLEAPHFRRFDETTRPWVFSKSVRVFARVYPADTPHP